MDFRLYARVFWRFRVIVAAGLLLAISLAVLSTVKLGPDGITYRERALWSSTTRLGITQQGFPWGRLFAQDPTTTTPGVAGDIPVADPNRLNNLTVLYAELAVSDAVKRLMRRDGPIRGEIIATPLVRGDNRIMLPLIDLTAIATSPSGSFSLAQRSAAAFETYMRQQQRANSVPAADRVIVQTVQKPQAPRVVQPRSKTLPIVVFLVVMFAVSGLVFLLENIRPRAQEPDAAPASFAEPQKRKSA